ncbi:hypothetical protein AB0J52_21430 [Spirillospora sp. NPDC049652]
MTTGVDEIDWASLQDAYGPADGFPRLLRGVVDSDPEVREEAVHELFGTVYHQGTLYTATPRAVPFVARVAADPATRESERASLVHLLGVIAEADDASPDVLADVRAALVRDIEILLTFLDDPDAETRHAATYLLGHLPSETAPRVVPLLRARRAVEQEPIVIAGLLAAAGRLAPDHATAAWLNEELAPDRPDVVRAGALWAASAAGLPWTSAPDASAETLANCWLDGEPLTNWVWSDTPFEDIALRLDIGPFAAICRAMLDQGTAEAARTAMYAVHERCGRSRSARPELAPLLAHCVDHPDPRVRLEAAYTVQDVWEAAPLAADALAARATRIAAVTTSGPAVRPDADAAREDASSADDADDPSLLKAALGVLVELGDPRWREPLVRALDAGRDVDGTLYLLVTRDVPCDDVLLGAVRRRLAAWWSKEGARDDTPFPDLLRDSDAHVLTKVIHHWGPDAAAAVPELIPLVPVDGWWAVRALEAIGPAASAAVPVLARVRDADGPWRRRLLCAEALAAITGDDAQLAHCVAAAAAGGDPVRAARTALRHDLPLDGLLPALRAAAAPFPPGTTAGSDVYLKRIDAARLLLEQGETGIAVRAAADALDAGIYTANALELAGLAGRAAADLEPRVRALLVRPHETPAALALFRITGESAPLVAALRDELLQSGFGRWLAEPLRELAPAAAELLPELRELHHGDAPVSRTGPHGWRRGETERDLARLIDKLTEPTP